MFSSPSMSWNRSHQSNLKPATYSSRWSGSSSSRHSSWMSWRCFFQSWKVEYVLHFSAKQYGQTCLRRCTPWCTLRSCFRMFRRCTRLPHLGHGICSLGFALFPDILLVSGWLAGWLAVHSTRSIELISMSSLPSYIVPVHPLVAPPMSILAYRLALPLAAPYASTPFRRNGMVHRFYRSYGKTRPASGARRCLRHFSFSLLIPTISLARSARSARLGGCQPCLAPRVLPPRVPRLSRGLCPHSSWRAQPHVCRLD